MSTLFIRFIPKLFNQNNNFVYMVVDFILIFVPLKFHFKYLFFVQTQNQIHNNKFASVHKNMNATENILFDLPVTSKTN